MKHVLKANCKMNFLFPGQARRGDEKVQKCRKRKPATFCIRCRTLSTTCTSLASSETTRRSQSVSDRDWFTLNEGFKGYSRTGGVLISFYYKFNFFQSDNLLINKETRRHKTLSIWIAVNFKIFSQLCVGWLDLFGIFFITWCTYSVTKGFAC